MWRVHQIGDNLGQPKAAKLLWDVRIGWKPVLFPGEKPLLQRPTLRAMTIWCKPSNWSIFQYWNIDHVKTNSDIQLYDVGEKKTYADLTVQNIRTPLSTSWSSSLRRSWRQIAWHQKPGGGIGDRLWDLREISSVWAEASHVFECLRCMKMLKLLGISTARLDGSHGVVCKKNTFDPGIELPQARAGHAKPF